MAAEIAKIDQNEDSESFFFDNIRSDNSELRLAAIGMARKIARKLGPQETMRSIFPLIQELTKEADEDIRFAILNELKDFIELMGGDTQASLLLDTLQTFLSSDDTTIRNYAYEVVLDIVKNLSPEKITDSFVPFVDELLNNEWFTARMSGMLLWSTAYTSSNEEKQEDLLKKLISLADDKIMSVRRIFAMMLADIFDLLGAQCFYNRIFDTAIHLFNDPLDSVKMSNIISFTILMPKMKDKVDESTKVFNLLRELSGLLHAANSDDILQKLLIDLNNLLDDREPEVRLAAAKILSKMFSKEHPEHVENFFTESMWERIENLITNSDSDMGSTMVEQIGKISLILSDHQYKENFIPLLERVLKNTVRNPEVKLKGLSILSCVRKENNLVEGLKDMSSSSTWRVRLSLVEHISIIAQSMVLQNITPRILIRQKSVGLPGAAKCYKMKQMPFERVLSIL
ncbi:hypothetical protein HZS_1271 [Henneguya salminicola]|nr:hypothetical protein HZS_1271 [Henneguya salminicola]